MDAAVHSARAIAIIGMACRFPGANDCAAFWRNLRDGVETRVELSDGELIAAGVDPALLTDPTYVRSARPIDDHDCFDAGLFEVSPREARLMDPQQRILLQTAWEALEDAGYRTDTYDGDVAVFVGGGGLVSSQFAAHPELRGQTGGLEHIGADKDFLATKLSYKLNLRGPSVTVQTACSTSLAAVHLACASLQAGECDLALAGASVVRTPQRVGYLAPEGDIHSPDGRCRAFDAEARGTVFGSGAGIVVLKPLADALADGDRVYAVIRGSALNNDGAAKMSYTASSVEGQAKAVMTALRRAGVDPDTVGFVEAHGAGTRIGDPLEVEALSFAFRTSTADVGYCALASVKSNIGHLEQAAGVAALIKTALCLYHRAIPPSLNFTTPNPRIDFAASPFFVPTRTLAWDTDGQPRRAGVNSLGLGGTNAFVVLEEAPAGPARRPEQRCAHVLCLSAQGEEPLEALAERWRDQLGGVEALPDLCFTANTGRQRLSHRLAVSGDNAEALRAQLDPGRLKITGPAEPGQIAFLFPGQGAQYAGMGQELFRTHAGFRADLERCAALLRPYLDRPLEEVLFARGPDAELLDRTDFTQPALFAIEWSLARLWMSWGLRPDVLVGHSVGEYVAACIAGVWELEQALPLVARRARLMQSLPAGGMMAALFAGGQAVDALAAGIDARQLSVAAYNGPLNTVVSGARGAVEALLARAEAAGVGSRRLAVSHAFHSPLVEPVLEEFAAIVAEYPARPPRIPVVGNLAGDVWREAPMPEYWRDHARQAVRMVDSLRTLDRAGAQRFLEVGPGSVLVSLARQTLRGGERGGRRFLTSIAGDSEWAGLCATAATLWTAGAPLNWTAFDAPYARRRVSAPTYPFRRERHAMAPARPPPTQGPAGLPGRRLVSPLDAAQFEAEVGLDRSPWLADHRIYGLPILPAAAVLIGLSEAGRARDGRPCVVRSLTYQQALIARDDGVTIVQTLLSDGAAEVLSHDPIAGGWTRHLTARLAQAEPRAAPQPLETAGMASIAPEQFYREIDALGLNYGPQFCNIVELFVGEGVAASRVVLPPALAADGPAMHPALLDACLHIYPVLAVPEVEAGKGMLLPVSVEEFELFGEPARDVRVAARRRSWSADGELIVDLDIFGTATGSPIAILHGLALRRIDKTRLAASGGGLEGALHAVVWSERLAPAPAASSMRWVVVGSGEEAARLEAVLGREGGRVQRLQPPLDIGDQSFPIQLEQAIGGEPGAVSVVLSFCAADDPAGRSLDALKGGERRLCGVALEAFQTLAAIDSREIDLKVWIVTRNAQRLSDTDGPVDPLQTELWALARAASLELGGLWGGALDIADLDDIDVAPATLRAGDVDQVALRGGRRLAPRLAPAPRPAGAAGSFAADGVRLVTGGLGAIGLRLARWLAERGARDLMLTSRSAASAEALMEIDRIEAIGARVSVVQADVAHAADVARVFADVSASGRALRSVFHCAGVLDDAVLSQMDWARFRRVTAAKVAGGWSLHLHTRDLNLEHFVLFSSVLSVTGAMGQCNYAAGNGFLDGLAAMRRQAGLPAQTLNWGPWAEAGLAVGAGERGEAIWRTRGAAYIPPGPALDLLGGLLADGREQAVICQADWARWAAQYPIRPALLASWSRGHGEPAAPARQEVLARLRRTVPEARGQVVTEIVDSLVRSLLELDSVEHHQTLRDFGFDSLMAITLANQIDAAFGLRLATGFLVEGPSVHGLVDEVCARLDAGALAALEPAA